MEEPNPAFGDESLLTDVKPGDVLAGKYRVDKVLGAGGMGVVVQATHLVLEDRVAIKFLLPEFVENEAVAARFLREAQAAVRIKSPNVARVVDVGTLGNGAPFMVMEFLAGRDLGQELDAHGTFDVETAAKYALQACEALAAAHAGGVIHRDIKPGNLFITQAADGSPLLKVLDFGISKVAGASGISNLTRTHAAMGSPTYMSPEQMRSAKDVDNRADVWSLGVVIYEMVAGSLPFLAESMPQLVALVLESDAPSVRAIRPEVDEAFDAIVSRCLQKDTTKRFQDVAELASALAPFAGDSGYESARRVHRTLHLGSSDPQVSQRSELARPITGGAHAQIMASTNTAFGQTASQPTPQQPIAVPNRTGLFAALGGGVAVIAVASIWLATQGARGEVPTGSGSAGIVANAATSASPVLSREMIAPTASAPASAAIATQPDVGVPDAKAIQPVRPIKATSAKKSSVFDDRK